MPISYGKIRLFLCYISRYYYRYLTGFINRIYIFVSIYYIYIYLRIKKI